MYLVKSFCHWIFQGEFTVYKRGGFVNMCHGRLNFSTIYSNVIDLVENGVPPEFGMGNEILF